MTRAHVLVCRGPDCTSRGALDVYTEMAAQRHARGLEEDEVVQSQTGCIGPLCGRGPVVCCYPTGAWYAPVGVGDVAEIVARDLGEGAVVERLEARRLEGAA
ncbi:MAG TPA: (2Fe-2S) ferredoxin domain-containing protein [Miltoncostaeaceae bacterium]|nr:(2Fe-2S) ferredoxin domain-containing protein [Miltoncostaeaceae bacterium]